MDSIKNILTPTNIKVLKFHEQSLQKGLSKVNQEALQCVSKTNWGGGGQGITVGLK